MKMRTVLWAGLAALPLIVAAPVLAGGSDRESGPAGAAGIGKTPARALDRHSPQHERGIRNVSGNEEFRLPARPESAHAPAKRDSPPRRTEGEVLPEEPFFGGE